MPLRPSPEDQISYQRFIQGWIEAYECPRILILGVTPELYHLPWPTKRDLIAVDCNRAMITHVWPGSEDAVVEADWRELPLPSGSRNLVLCDGGFMMLDYPVGHRKLIVRLHNVLSPGGRCVLRLFASPEAIESPAGVIDDLLAGRIADMNILKLRLFLSMQRSPVDGLAVHDVWRIVHEAAGKDWEQLARRLGWPIEHFYQLDFYRDSPARYHSVTQEETERLFCAEEKFSCLGYRIGNYPLAERCPVVAFQRR